MRTLNAHHVSQVKQTEKNNLKTCKPNPALLYLVCSQDHSKNRLWHTTGDDCLVQLILELFKTAKEGITEMRTRYYDRF